MILYTKRTIQVINRNKKLLALIFGLSLLFFYIQTSQTSFFKYKQDRHSYEWLRDENNKNPAASAKLTDKVISEIQKSPIIFIGGYARSGTTLIRAILDVHEDISCGPETKVVPTLLKFIVDYKKKHVLMKELVKAGFSNSTVDSATSLFIYYVLENHIRHTKHLCAKDPDIVYHIEYLHRLFPEAKFVYMVRDGRAVAYSMLTRLEQEKTFHKMRSYLSTWNTFNANVYKQCQSVGEKYCRMVKYEDLILNNNETLRNLSKFLNVSWTNDFLRHSEFVGNKVAVSNLEWSTDQIKNPIYTESISGWVGKIKDYNNKIVKRFVYMLSKFGYDLEIE